jgi:hypothetical protein
LKRFPKVSFELGVDKQRQQEMDDLFAKVRERENW